MGQTDTQKIACAGCGRQYRWKPELAGKKVRCGCGHVVAVPAAPKPNEEPLDDLEAGLYALAEDEKRSARSGAIDDTGYRCPSCQQPMEVGSVVCVSCGFNVKLGRRGAAAASTGGMPMMAGGAVAAVGTVGGAASPILGYAGSGRREQAVQTDDNKLLDLWIPLGMLAFGIVASFARLMYFTDDPLSFGIASVVVFVRLAIDMVMLAIGCLLAIKLLDVALGSPGLAALKIAAIAIAPGALAEILRYYMGAGAGAYGAWVISAIMYFVLFYYLFDFDFGEVLVLSAIVFLIRTWVGMLIAGVLIAMLLSGTDTSGVFGTVAAVTDSRMASDDEHAEELMELGWTHEGKAWINDSLGRIIGNMGHEPSVQIIEGFYTAGVEKDGVQIEREGPAVITLIVKMPRGKANRAKIINYANSLVKTHDMPPVEDKGQKYLVYHFAG